MLRVGYGGSCAFQDIAKIDSVAIYCMLGFGQSVFILAWSGSDVDYVDDFMERNSMAKLSGRDCSVRIDKRSSGALASAIFNQMQDARRAPKVDF